jgi:hypothetical protein
LKKIIGSLLVCAAVLSGYAGADTVQLRVIAAVEKALGQ